MKGKAVLGAILFALMFLIPFFAMGAKIPDKNGKSDASSSASQPKADPQAQLGSGFRILDVSAKKVIRADDKTFLYGAIAAEMSPLAPQEALKAQGVAAYTYYSRLRGQRRENPASELGGADFSADPKNWNIYVGKDEMQARWGGNFSAYYDKLTPVVEAVYGQVLESGGSLIDATYYAISSGMTESSEEIWGGKRPYLISVASPGDAFAGGFQTTVSLSADQFRTAALKAAPKTDLSGDPSSWIGAIKRTTAGSVSSVVIGGASVTGSAARAAFGLRSANFTVSFADGKFTFLVKGYGHGVGMSQVGAQYMANQGANYQQILAWYYPTAQLKKAGV